jgi:hypothetical protein
MENSAEYLTFIDVIKILGGTSVVLIALITFIGRIWINRIRITDKAKTDKELKELDINLSAKVDALKAKNESKIHVHKMQFEKEFSEYQELWKKAVSLDRNLRALRSKLSDHDSYDKALTEYYDSFSEMMNFNLNSHPFYYKTVYNSSVSIVTYIQDFHDPLNNHLDYLNALGSDMEDDFQEYDVTYLNDELKGGEVALGDKMKKLSRDIRERWQGMVLIENDL